MATESAGARALLRQFARRIPAIETPGERLATIPRMVAEHMVAEVCSIYLLQDRDTLLLCANHGLNPEAINRIRLRTSEGLVGRVAREGAPVATANAPGEPEFRYIPEIGEEPFLSFLGVPIRRQDRTLGVLVVQNRAARSYEEEDFDALALVALVLAEMAESGQILRPRPPPRPLAAVGVPVNPGFAIGTLVRHEPALVVTRPVAEDPETELGRLRDAFERLRGDVDRDAGGADPTGVLDAYRRIVHDRRWLDRMEGRIRAGLSAEAAVDDVHARTRARMESRGDAYLQERLREIDDIAARLLCELLGTQQGDSRPHLPEDAILVARDISAGDFLNYPRDAVRALALEEGSTSSHASIVAGSFDIPVVVQAGEALREGEEGDTVIVDGGLGRVFIRPTSEVQISYRDRLAMRQEQLAELSTLRGLPTVSADGVAVDIFINAGLLSDFEALEEAGAEGVGLFRTELPFIAGNRFPRRDILTGLYQRAFDLAGNHPVIFRTVDLGGDKPLPGYSTDREANPALGLRGVRFALEHPLILRMQVQAMLRAAAGRDLQLMFPMIASAEEFAQAREIAERARDLDQSLPAGGGLVLGAMLETPSLADAPDSFFREVQFLSVGGNDLHQFFFAVDRTNERVRSRFDSMHGAFLRLLRRIALRCQEHGLPLSFCGEIAGDPLMGLALASLGYHRLSVRPAAVGLVKRTLRSAALGEAQEELHRLLESGEDEDVRGRFGSFAASAGWPVA